MQITFLKEVKLQKLEQDLIAAEDLIASLRKTNTADKVCL